MEGEKGYVFCMDCEPLRYVLKVCKIENLLGSGHYSRLDGVKALLRLAGQLNRAKEELLEPYSHLFSPAAGSHDQEGRRNTYIDTPQYLPLDVLKFNPPVIQPSIIIIIITLPHTTSPPHLLPDPKRMIRTHIPHTTQAQLLPNVHIPLLPFLSPFRQGRVIANVFLPRGAAVYALDSGGGRLGASPLVEAIFVDVVAAGRFAVDDFFRGGIEFHETDWAVARDFFAVVG